MSRGDIFAASSIVQIKTLNSNDKFSSTGVIPTDTSIPQISEGTELLSITITPSSTSNYIYIKSVFHITPPGGYTNMTYAVFNGNTNAVRSGLINMRGSSLRQIVVAHREQAPSTSPVTYSIRFGDDTTATWWFNRFSSFDSLGASFYSNMTLWELKP